MSHSDSPNSTQLTMDQASNLRAAYRILEDRVEGVLRVQIGDRRRLSAMRNDVLAFMAAIGNVCHQARKAVTGLILLPLKQQILFPREELELIMSNVKTMVRLLDETEVRSIDPPTSPVPSLSHLNRTGVPGRPRIEIDPDVLSRTLALEPKTTLANVLGCSTQTIRRRQQEVERRTGASLTPQRQMLSNEELDSIINGILGEFPHYGQSMLIGAMTFHGYNVPESRIRESISRVCGAPSHFFGSRPIHRRKYYVPAANSLWHHDGQHGGFHLSL